MPTSSTIKLCPQCGSILQRYPRRLFDKIIGLFVTVKRYKCENRSCQFSTLKAPDNKLINSFINIVSNSKLLAYIFICMLLILLYFVTKLALGAVIFIFDSNAVIQDIDVEKIIRLILGI